MDTVSIDSLSLYSQLGSPGAALLLDVRRDAAFDADDRLLAGALRAPANLVEFAGRMAQGRQVVVYCVHGHEVSQDAASALRAGGLPALYLVGGIEAWKAGKFPTVLVLFAGMKQVDKGHLNVQFAGRFEGGDEAGTQVPVTTIRFACRNGQWQVDTTKAAKAP